MKWLLGQRLVSFCRAYSVLPGTLIQELHRILILIRCRRRYADDAEVLLCQLRTNAHIVDKGLQADTWEPGRGRVPYETLCRCISRLKDSVFSTDPSFLWAVQKKVEYEEVQKAGQLRHHPFGPVSTKMGKNDLLEVIQSRRSIRSFEDRPIEHGILSEFASVINWSPTSCNRQPGRLFVTQDHAKVTTCIKQCAGATCCGKAAPCFIAVCADARFYTIQDRTLPVIDVSLGLQNMLLIAHIQGIEAMILNWTHHTRQEDKILRRTLSIPEYYLVVVNLVLGYPARSAPAPGRKSANLALTFVR